MVDTYGLTACDGPTQIVTVEIGHLTFRECVEMEGCIWSTFFSNLTQGRSIASVGDEVLRILWWCVYGGQHCAL